MIFGSASIMSFHRSVQKVNLTPGRKNVKSRRGVNLKKNCLYFILRFFAFSLNKVENDIESENNEVETNDTGMCGNHEMFFFIFDLL